MSRRYWNMAIIWIVLGMTLAGCGTLATPVWQEDAPTAAMTSKADEATVTTATSLPTDTPVPPTSTPTQAPTLTSTPPPAPTDAPPTRVSSPIDRLAAVRDPENGKLLFETFQEAANYACSTCHSVISEDTLVGPGLLNIKARALERVAGQSAAEYIYESIVKPDLYLVEGFDAELMPENWMEIYSNIEIFDMVAYLLTLEGESVSLGEATDGDEG